MFGGVAALRMTEGCGVYSGVFGDLHQAGVGFSAHRGLCAATIMGIGAAGVFGMAAWADPSADIAIAARMPIETHAVFTSARLAANAAAHETQAITAPASSPAGVWAIVSDAAPIPDPAPAFAPGPRPAVEETVSDAPLYTLVYFPRVQELDPPPVLPERRATWRDRYWTVGDPSRGDDFAARLGNDNWRFDLQVDVATRYGQGEDERGQVIDDFVFDISPSLDIELKWLEEWLEARFQQRFQVELTAVEEDFRGDGDSFTGDPVLEGTGDPGDPAGARRVSSPSLRLRQERLTLRSGQHRLIFDLNNGAGFLSAQTAPVTGVRQVLGPALELAARELPTGGQLPIVTPVQSRGVTKAIYAYSFAEDRSLPRRRRTTDGLAVSVALEEFEPSSTTTVERPIEATVWKTVRLGPTSTRMSAIYSWGDARGLDQDINSWGVGALTAAGPWRFGASFADHGASLQRDPNVRAYGVTYGIARGFGEANNPLTIAASGAYTREDNNEYRAYSIGAQLRVSTGLLFSVDVATFNDESVVDDAYGFVVMTELRITPRWGSMCRMVGLYNRGREGC